MSAHQKTKLSPNTGFPSAWLQSLVVLGFCADALTTWWGINHVQAIGEGNPVPAHLMATHGVAHVVLLVTLMKLLAILCFFGLVALLRNAKGFGRSDRIIGAGFVVLLFIGWLPAIWNLSLITKGT